MSLRIRHAEKDGGGDDGEDGKRQASVERHKKEAMSRKEKKVGALFFTFFIFLNFVYKKNKFRLEKFFKEK